MIEKRNIIEPGRTVPESDEPVKKASSDELVEHALTRLAKKAAERATETTPKH